MRYSVLRLLLFFGCLMVFFLVQFATHIPTAVVVVLAAATSLALSLVVLKGPREEMAARMAARIDSRLPPAPADGSDEAVEDAADEDARRQSGA
jgi:Flp pilus assembly protein TadB